MISLRLSLGALAAAASLLVQGKVPVATLVAYETTPVETDLGNADLAEAAQVWPALLDGARESIDLAFFYASPKSNGDADGAPDRGGDPGTGASPGLGRND